MYWKLAGLPCGKEECFTSIDSDSDGRQALREAFEWSVERMMCGKFWVDGDPRCRWCVRDGSEVQFLHALVGKVGARCRAGRRRTNGGPCPDRIGLIVTEKVRFGGRVERKCLGTSDHAEKVFIVVA